MLSNVKLTSQERATAKVLMVVGQTGSGKTTLLNAMVNYHMGVEFTDSFRYVIILEEFERSQAESQTINVKEYYIRAHQDKPALIIVDSPGFGDTRGIDHDY